MRRLPIATTLALPAAVVAVAYVALYLSVALPRVAFPYELEWMEGGSADHVARVLAHRPLYVAPDVAFTPYLYAPLYYYVAALPAALFGISLPVLRAVSLLATLGTFGLLGAFVWRETRSWVATLIGPGLFAATYPSSGAWFELARVDSLALAWTLAGAFTLRFAAAWPAAVAGGALLAAACFTKQSFALVACAPLLWALAARWRLGLVAAGTAGTLLLVAAAAHDLATGGWFRAYVLVLPTQHPTWTAGWRDVGERLLLRPLGPAVAVTIAGALFAAHERSWRALSFHALLVGAAVVTSMRSMAHSGAFDNVAMPAHAALALAAALALGGCERWAREGASRRAVLATAAVTIALVTQLALLRWDPAPHRPAAADRAAGARVVAALAAVPGDVWVPAHGHLGALAGKPMHAQWFALKDVLRSSNAALSRAVVAGIENAIASRRYAAILLDSCEPRIDGFELGGYRLEADLLGGTPMLWTRTGLRARPSCLFVRR